MLRSRAVLGATAVALTAVGTSLLMKCVAVCAHSVRLIAR